MLNGAVAPDPRPAQRVRDSQLLQQLHLEWRECAICRATGPFLSLHHITKHPRSDVRGNLVMLCGSGTTGCHGKIEARDEETMRALGGYLLRVRGDTIAYLYETKGAVAAQEWMRANYML